MLPAILQGVGTLLVLGWIFLRARRVTAKHMDEDSAVSNDPYGRELLDPLMAQHAKVFRFPAFLSIDEIDIIRCEARRHRESHPDAGFTLYLQHGGVDPLLQTIIARIREQVRRVDAEHWGLNAMHALEGVSGVRYSPAGDEGTNAAAVTAQPDGDAASHVDDDAASEASNGAASAASSSATASYCTDGRMHARTVEFHEYSSRARKICANHCDHGSLFTADVMLSRDADFEGGQMVTTVVEAGAAPVLTRHVFDQGDLLVFPSHKPHSVERVTSGTRTVFVVEFWRGPECQCDQRCIGGCAARQGAPAA